MIKLKKTFILSIYFLLMSTILAYGLGYFKKPGVISYIMIAGFFICYFVSSRSKLCSIILFTIFSISSIYFPTGITYGLLSKDIMLPLIGTNSMEIFGYILAMKYYFGISILFVILNIPFIFMKKKGGSSLVYIFFIFLISFVMYGFSNSNVYLNDHGIIRVALRSIIEINHDNIDFYKELNDNSKLKSERSNKNFDPEIRILVIGESVRRDYMSLYGYPYQTTPYLDSSNGIFIDGMTSAAPNTEQSLGRALFKTYPDQNKIDHGINIISLAKKAGYLTYWVSNQGRSSNGDSKLYKLSKLGNESYFMKKGDFLSSYEGDEDMLPIIEKIVRSNDNKKVIIIHMMGSHEPVCSRLTNFTPQFKINNEAGCYVASIEKLDGFIKNIISIVNGKSYKLMYFSDHGLYVDKDKIFHDVDLYDEYQVPFFYLSSNMKSRVLLNKKVSGLNILDFYASFINVKSNYTDSIYNIEDYNKIPESKDPIIYWVNYKKLSALHKKQRPLNPSYILGQDGINEHILNINKPISAINNCIGYIDNYSYLYPSNKSITLTQGWIASVQDKKPVIGRVGLIINHNGNYSFIEGSRVKRIDVYNALNNRDPSNIEYGISVKAKKRENIEMYLGYINNENKAYICT
ncbi:phosphoethanolamine transferase, partial [Enterobacter cloacae complex sp. IR5422]